MADIYDVQVALTTLAAQAIYPNTTSSPSIINNDVRIYPGWPIPDTLDADLILRKAHVSIFPSDVARATTRFQPRWDTVSISAPTITLTVSGNTVTVGGTVSTPQACMVFSDYAAYSYGVLSTDTTATIAAALAAMIPNASAAGSVITIGNNPYSLHARVIISGQSLRELAREMRMIIVTVWASNPQDRATLGNAMNVLFAATYRVSLPDGTWGQLSYGGSHEVDILEKVRCYRRDIHFLFEYGITQPETDYTIGDNIVNISYSPVQDIT